MWLAVLGLGVALGAEPPPAPVAQLGAVVELRHATIRLSSPQWAVSEKELKRLVRDWHPAIPKFDECVLKARATEGTDLNAELRYVHTRRAKVREMTLVDGIDDGPVDGCLRTVVRDHRLWFRPFNALEVTLQLSLLETQNPNPNFAPPKPRPQPTSHQRATRFDSESVKEGSANAYGDSGGYLGMAHELNGGSSSAFLLRLRMARGKRSWNPLMYGVSSDIRLQRAVASHTQAFAGVHLLPRQRTRVALYSGLGMSQRRLFNDPLVRFWVPVHTSVRWISPKGDVSVVGRGGPNFSRSEEGETVVEPDVLVGVTWNLGTPDTNANQGVRFELGYREELARPTLTWAFGVVW